MTNSSNSNSSSKQVYLYSDGACKGNPGPGGWGTILVYGENEKELSGGDSYTTNNKMEITGIIEGLKALKEPCDVIVTTDSQYVVNTFNRHWIDNWQRHNWKKSDGSDVANVDLWKILLDLIDKNISVKFEWIKGHNGHPYNERCDRLAVAQRDKF